MPLAISGTYTYAVPDEMENPQTGMRVLVPLARKEAVGIVLGEHTEELSDTIRVREIISILDADPIITPDQLSLWQWIADYYMCPIGDVMAAAMPAKALDKHYTLSETKRRRVRLPEYNGEIAPLNTLDEQQARALKEIQQSEHDIVLLHGVTSSGKTEVYMHLIDEELKAGRQVLYLVPEIALTTQLTDRLQHVFGNQCLVYHSRVTDAQRMETYRQLLLTDQTEKPRVIIGARSAVFLPIHRLGLIIVDEEHEPSYKQQDPAPRYHARSVAIMRAKMTGQDGAPCRVLLGTATPSVESYQNARTGKYGLVTMPERHAGLSLPKTRLIDLKRQYHRKEMYGHLSDPLVLRIQEELERGKQIILFQNRRGYAPYMQCIACGKTPKCTNCDVSLTVHMRSRLLTCHYCGDSQHLPDKCPHCGGELRIHGLGTERLEDEVTHLFPTARVLRMDLDTTRNKDDYQNIINSFAAHECDILIGTQMVSKGLHFDDVSLVAVLNADTIVNTPDFRSYERAFDMLEQVSGRAGRTGQQGEVIIQTYDIDQPLYTSIAEHDYTAMFDKEIAEREYFNYPPFYRMVYITIRHNQLDRVTHAGRILGQRLKQAFGERCSIVLEPSVSRIQQKHLRQIRLRIEATANFARARKIIGEQIQATTQDVQCKGVEILTDVDPM